MSSTDKRTGKKHALIVNVYFVPNSFGGATIVAENMGELLKAKHGWDVTVLTTITKPELTAYSLIRYEIKGISVIAINLPPTLSFEQSYKHSDMKSVIKNVVCRVAPDVAHIHSIQHVGAEMLDVFKELNVPTALTVHDCWWICERQFMIKNNDTYCHQEKINLNICARCTADPQSTMTRFNYLTRQLSKADILLYPSAFQRALLIKNGAEEARSFVNKNGIIIPPAPYKKQSLATPTSKVRFGFTGGPGPIKGLNLIKDVFTELDRDDYELVLVDAAQNINTTWRYDLDMDIQGKLTIAPAYNQNTMDDFFGNIDVLLFPSMWKESFGLTVREALARNVWVIASNGGGTVEDCVDGENSTIIPLLNNSQYLYDAVQKTFDKDWTSYINPHIADLQTVEGQALELSTQLSKLLN